MVVSCGIVGLPNVGKSTIFNALTAAQAESGNYPFSTLEANLAVVEVPDPNLAVLGRYVETQRIVPAVVNVVDIAGLEAGASKGAGLGNKFLASIRECDAIMHVVRCFESPSVVREAPLDPAGDIDVLEAELALADLETVERGLERVAKKARSGDKEATRCLEVYGRAKELLEQGTQLRSVAWKPDELELLVPLCLMTAKRMLYVANVGEDDLAGEGSLACAVAERAGASGAPWLPLCGDLECELRRLEGEDRTLFMRELGVEVLGLERLIRATYALLGLQTYYTAGEKEIKAWTVRRGDTAPRAAGVIHTDFEKGFIRVQVYGVGDLVEHGSEAAIKAAGKLRTEGRDYVMREGDVCHFLFKR